MRSTCILGMALAVLVLVQGCAPGYNSVLFATRSNIGFDADTEPPNLEVAISRHEGVLEPTFEGGQTVPVMASFSSESNAITKFFWGVRSTFSTGEAAFIMSDLYDGKTPEKKKMPTYKRVTLSKVPKARLFGFKVHYLEAGNVKPVLFGTDTTLGVKVKWSGQTAQYPSSVNIGFKRKEAALAPVAVASNRITESSNPNNATTSKPTESSKPDNAPSTEYVVDIPSLLATIDTDVAVEKGAKLTYLQYFATGSAASNLARQRAVREAMLKRADPLQAQIAEKAKKEEEQRESNRELIKKITEIFNKSDENKTKILAKAQALKLVDQTVTKENFVANLKKHEAGDASITEKLKELAKFASELK